MEPSATGRFRHPRLALLALALVILAPLAAAGAPAAPLPGVTDVGEQVRFTLEHVGRVDPGRDRAVNVTVTLCAGSGGVSDPTPQEVSLQLARAPGWLSAAFAPRVFIFEPVLPGQCRSTDGVVRLASTPEAPGFRLAQFTLVANVEGATGPGIGYEENVTFVSGYYSDLEVTSPASLDAAPGTATDLTVTVENRGNSLTRVRFEAVDVPAGVAVTLVDATGGVAPRGEAAATRDFRFRVALGDDAPSEPFDLTLRLESHYYFEGSIRGESVDVVVRVEPGGSLAGLFEVPAPSPALLLAGVGVALAVWRRTSAS